VSIVSRAATRARPACLACLGHATTPSREVPREERDPPLRVALERQEGTEKSPEATDNSRCRRPVHHRVTNIVHDAWRDNPCRATENESPAEQRYDEGPVQDPNVVRVHNRKTSRHRKNTGNEDQRTVGQEASRRLLEASGSDVGASGQRGTPSASTRPAGRGSADQGRFLRRPPRLAPSPATLARQPVDFKPAEIAATGAHGEIAATPGVRGRPERSRRPLLNRAADSSRTPSRRALLDRYSHATGTRSLALPCATGPWRDFARSCRAE
jgi:hypothetical protein